MIVSGLYSKHKSVHILRLVLVMCVLSPLVTEGRDFDYNISAHVSLENLMKQILIH